MRRLEPGRLLPRVGAWTRGLAAAVGLVLVGPAHAQPAAAPLALTYEAQLRERSQLQPRVDTTLAGSPDAGIQRLEIDGLVVDLTMTRIGREFYEVFYRLWRAPDGALNFTITVQEQPLPGTGTSVTVLVNEEIAFQARLQPREDVIDGAARAAIAAARRRLTVRASADTGI